MVFGATLAVIPETVHVRVHEAGGSDVVVERSVPPSPTVKTNVAVSVYPLFVMYGQVHVPGPENGLAGGEEPWLELAQAAPTPASRATLPSARITLVGVTASRVAHLGAWPQE
jgi:hypothetical protein